MQSKELEVALAEMENHLRGTVVRVLRPALEQLSELEFRMKGIAERINEHETILGKVDGIQTDCGENRELIKAIDIAVQKFSEQILGIERAMVDGDAAITMTVTEHGNKLKEHDTILVRHTREDAGLWEEAKRLQQLHEQGVKKTTESFTQSNRRMEMVRMDLVDSIKELQRQRQELLADLFGEGVGLAKINSHLRKLDELVVPMPKIMQTLQEQKKDLQRVEEQHAEIVQTTEDRGTYFDDAMKTQEKERKDLRAEVKLVCNNVVAHSAEVMKDIRSDYKIEVDSIKDMRLDIQKTISTSDKTVKILDDKLDRESRRIDALHRELSQDIEEMHTSRKKDRVVLDCEVQQVRQEIDADRTLNTKLRSSVEYLSRLFGLTLEASRVATSLQIQDYADRSSERWLSVPRDHLGPAQPLKPQELEKRRQRREELGFKASEDVVKDREVRGGLCRGGYQPGRVPYGGQTFDRQDLLILLNRLLIKASTSFNNGPPPEATKPPGGLATSKPAAKQIQRTPVQESESDEAFAVAMQPAARGGESAEQVQEDPKLGYTPKDKVNSESPGQTPPLYGKSPPTSSGARQRPGSQGQPQAIGSRGTALGPLGETEPPPGHEGVRLPSIHQNSGTPAAIAGCRAISRGSPHHPRSGSFTVR
eukprot:TRINITY_DN3849_c0_g1_i2.p1 TRINITY_DN3849_c0_g1~~TRINITY_DN3849_c0_g1_i2.p1  ORF type:complete len:650 (+),score=125.64 TRINITY_DN3849_c0_g1_i2:243-2192(+)